MKQRIDKSSRAKCPSPCQSSDIICFVWVTFLPRFTAASFCSVLLHSKQWSQRWNEMIHFLPAFPAMLQRSVQPGHLPNRHRGQQMRHAQRSFKPCIKFWLMQPENILRTWQRSKHGLHGLWSSIIIIHDHHPSHTGNPNVWVYRPPTYPTWTIYLTFNHGTQ